MDQNSSGKSLTIYQELDELQTKLEPIVEAETALQLLQSVYRNTSLHLSTRSYGLYLHQQLIQSTQSVPVRKPLAEDGWQIAGAETG
jgi:hypothetical protein